MKNKNMSSDKCMLITYLILILFFTSVGVYFDSVMIIVVWIFITIVLMIGIIAGGYDI